MVTVSVRHVEGNRPRPSRRIQVRLLKGGNEAVGEGTDGEDVRITLSGRRAL